MRVLLAIHAILLLLASTDFTVVTAPLGSDSFRWCYFKYASQNGFGDLYVSDYSGLVTSTYLLAFAVGIAGFALAVTHGRRLVGTLGVVLLVIGLLSFAIEGSHWIATHNRSWLAFSPGVMFVLVLLAFLPMRHAIATQSHS